MNCLEKGNRGTRWTVTPDRAVDHGEPRPLEVPGQPIKQKIEAGRRGFHA
jgi:hypothetical protein